MENRFEGAIWYEEVKKLTGLVVGLGATGSAASFLLSRLGFNRLNLIDFDSYDERNLGSQLIDYQSIGKNKAEAVANMLRNMTSIKSISTFNMQIQQVHPSLFNNNVILATLDSMEGRKYMFEKFCEYTTESTVKKLFLDTRIGAEYYEVYCVPNRQDYKDRYAQTLFSDAQGNVGACNYQQSSHSANMAACEVAKLVTNWVTNNIIEEEDIPFKITHDFRTNSYAVNY